jgi:hypothetical protein
MIYPLSQFDGKMKTTDWKNAPSFPAPPSTGGETKWVIPEKFFDEPPIILEQVPPTPGEEAMYATFQSVLDAAAKAPRIKRVLNETAVAAERDLIAPLFAFHNNGRSVGNGWTSPPNEPTGATTISPALPPLSPTCTTTHRRRLVTSTPTSTQPAGV